MNIDEHIASAPAPAAVAEPKPMIIRAMPNKPSCGIAEGAESVSADSALPPYPRHSFIGRFVAYAETQVETPTPFLVATALKLTEAMLARRVYYPWGTSQRVFSNTFHAMIGPSGQTRRSQGIDLGESILRAINSEHLLATITSAERLVGSFQKQNVRVLLASEGKAVTDMVNRSHEMVTLLLKLYDSQPISTEFKKDRQKATDNAGNITETCRIEVPEPFLSIGLGIAPEVWRLNDSNQENGLMGRFLLQYADRRGRNIYSPPPKMDDTREQLIKELAQLGKLSGAMQFSPEAEQAFLEINKENHRRLDEPMPPAIGSFLSRMPFTILRIAISFEAATSQSLVISRDSVRYAKQHVEQSFENFKYFLGEMRKDKFMRCCDRILQALNRHGPKLDHSGLFSRVSSHGQYTAKDFKAALRHLDNLGKITFVAKSKGHFPAIKLVKESKSRCAKVTPADTVAYDEHSEPVPPATGTAVPAPAATETPPAMLAQPLQKATEPARSNTILTIDAKHLKKAVTAAATATITEYTEIFDNLAFYFTANGLYVAGTNNRQLAVVRIPPAWASCVQDNTRILVNAELFAGILKAFRPTGEVTMEANGDNLTVSYAGREDSSQLVHIQMPPAELRSKYPNCLEFLQMEFGTRIEVRDKHELVDALKTVRRATEVATIKAEAGKDEIEIHGPEKPVVVRCAAGAKGLEGMVSVPAKFLLDSLRSIEGERIVLAFNTDKKRAAVQSENPNHFYLTQILRRPPE
jgi:hypothetical protein